MEFKDAKGRLKKATCKVVKPCAFADANNKPGKSVMYVGQEVSTEGSSPATPS